MSIIKAFFVTLGVGAFGYCSTQTPLVDGYTLVFLAAVFIAFAIYFLTKESK